MDKELLRIVIIAAGLIVIIGMLLWSYFKTRKTEDRRAWYGESVPANHEDDFDDESYGSAKPKANKPKTKSDRLFDQPADFELEDFELDGDDLTVARMSIPPIIQFSIVAKADEGFNGVHLIEAFKTVGLEYGSLKIFERLDANRLVDFGVACMVEPGTFPDKNLQTFFCPGIVFFMQPGELDDARAVFDDFIETIQLLANELHGEVWDHKRQPLSDETIAAIRLGL